VQKGGKKGRGKEEFDKTGEKKREKGSASKDSMPTARSSLAVDGSRISKEAKHHQGRGPVFELGKERDVGLFWEKEGSLTNKFSGKRVKKKGLGLSLGNAKTI